jgi:hypothetical protein
MVADKNTYKVFAQFKNGKNLEFTIETESGLKKAFLGELGTPYITIGDFIIDTKEILWARIQGDKVEENDAEHSE